MADDSGANRVGRVSSRTGWVQERLIAALVPDAVGACDEVMVAPLPVLPALSWLEDLTRSALVVSTTRMDQSGRVQARILLRELGWEPGQRLEMMHGLILIAATPPGTPSGTPFGRHVVDVVVSAYRRHCDECAASRADHPSYSPQLYPNR